MGKNLQISWAKILKIKNAKISGHCFNMNTNINGGFQICICVPLILKLVILTGAL